MIIQFKKMLPYLSVCFFVYLLTPFIFNDTGGYISSLLVLTPIICFLLSVFYGFKNGANLTFPVLVGFLFIPIMSAFYNEIIWIYPCSYAVISLIGMVAGFFFGKMKRKF